ncbi:MAG: hypothetical protein Q8M62_03785, partial [Algoriphagus sp.]|uniref:hypothetical protein n=1 Tax=Algoriphagus sp. TaxID=1872435 RepID=UPI0027335A65
FETPLFHSQKIFLQGGQFTPASGGQFAPARRGQFPSASGGQFDRILHISIENGICQVITQRCDRFYGYGVTSSL